MGGGGGGREIYNTAVELTRIQGFLSWEDCFLAAREDGWVKKRLKLIEIVAETHFDDDDER